MATTGTKHIYDQSSPTDKVFHLSSYAYFMVTKCTDTFKVRTPISPPVFLSPVDFLPLLWFSTLINLCFELSLMNMVKILIASGLCSLSDCRFISWMESALETIPQLLASFSVVSIPDSWSMGAQHFLTWASQRSCIYPI